MNTIAFIILLALIFDFALYVLADYLNLNRLNEVLPGDFEAV